MGGRIVPVIVTTLPGLEAAVEQGVKVILADHCLVAEMGDDLDSLLLPFGYTCSCRRGRTGVLYSKPETAESVLHDPYDTL